MSSIIREFFHRPTGSLRYLLHFPAIREAVTVDQVWNFYPEAGATSLGSRP